MEMTGPVNQPIDKSMLREERKKKKSELMKCKCDVTTGKTKHEGGVTAKKFACDMEKRILGMAVFWLAGDYECLKKTPYAVYTA